MDFDSERQMDWPMGRQKAKHLQTDLPKGTQKHWARQKEIR